MLLTETQRELLQVIDNKLQRGDIKNIAAQTGFTREYVGKCLNVEADFFNEKIIDAAIKIISKREKYVKDTLKTIAAA